MRRGVLLILFLMFSVSLQAAEKNPDRKLVKSDSLASLRTLLARHQVIKGQFKQIRVVKDLDLSLVSEGVFQFRQPLDLTWNQRKPFVLDLLMTPDRIVQTKIDGSQQVMTREEQPIVFVFSSSFLAVFSGDEKAIAKNFEYQFKNQKKRWLLNLKPKDEILQKVISQIDIGGSEFVDKVEVLEKSGNSTTVTFSQVKGIP